MSRRLVVLFGSFVMLGLPEGVLGTAWPSMRSSFERPESALATLLIAYTIGYLISSAAVGTVIDRFDLDPTIRAGSIVFGLGIGAYLLAPVWFAVVGAAVVLGLGAGVVDASVNADIALHHDQRTMNLLHGAFGVGATTGPLLITMLLAIGGSWRIAYLVLLVAQLLVIAAFAPGRSARSGDSTLNVGRHASRARRPRLVLAMTLLYFAAYVAAEVSVGNWSYSVLTESRGVGTSTAGFAVAAYWGGLTVGRIGLGVIGERLHPLSLLRVSGLVALGAISWFLTAAPGSLVALPILGLAFAGTFPALVLMTSSWLPPEMVTRAVGWQLAASSGGAIVAAAVLGATADRFGLSATVTGMVVMVALLAGAHLATESAART